MTCRVCDPGPCYCPVWDREPQPTQVEARPVTLADQALEDHALQAEYRLTVEPRGGGWRASGRGEAAQGATIADAVRACVAKIKGRA